MFINTVIKKNKTKSSEAQSNNWKSTKQGRETNKCMGKNIVEGKYVVSNVIYRRKCGAIAI